MSLNLKKFVRARGINDIINTVIRINTEIGLSDKTSINSYPLYDRESPKISHSSGRIYLVTEYSDLENFGMVAYVRELHTLSPITFTFGPVEGYTDNVTTGPYIRMGEIEVYGEKIEDGDLNTSIDRNSLPIINCYNDLSSVLSILSVMERKTETEPSSKGTHNLEENRKEKEPIDYHSLAEGLARFGADYPLRIEQARAGSVTNDLSAELQSARSSLTTLKQSKFHKGLTDFIANRTKTINVVQKLLEDRLKGWRRVGSVYIPSVEAIYAFSANN